MFNYGNMDKALKHYLDSLNVKRVIQWFSVALPESWRTHKTQKEKEGEEVMRQWSQKDNFIQK